MATSVLALAIERRNWRLAALCLLLGVAEQASRLPPETLESLLELTLQPVHFREQVAGKEGKVHGASIAEQMGPARR